MSHTKGIAEAVPSTSTHSRSSEIDEEALIDQWHLDDDDPDMADEVSIEETGEPEAESGEVDDDDGEDHDEFDLGDIYGDSFVMFCNVVL